MDSITSKFRRGVAGRLDSRFRLLRTCAVALITLVPTVSSMILFEPTASADVSSVSVSADSYSAGDTAANWTIDFHTPSSLSGTLGDTVTVTCPVGFDVSVAGTVSVDSTFGCNFGPPGSSSVGQAVTITLTGSCGGLTGPADTSVTLDGINASVGTYPTSGFTVSTSQDTNPVAATGAIPTDTITFDSEGGSAVSSMSGPDGTMITLPAAPTYPGYSFNGWFVATSGGSALTSPYTLAGSTTLYAQWSLSAYSITFAPNFPVPTKGSGTMATESVAFGVATVLPPDAFSDTGYTFAGWSTNPGGGGNTYSNGQSITVSAPVVLYAQWSANLYTVTYSANTSANTQTVGGNGAADKNSPYPWGATVTVLDNTGSLKLLGYAFVGWCTSDTATSPTTCNGTTYAAGSTFTITANTVLYSLWKAVATATLTVKAPTNGTVKGLYAVINCPQKCSTTLTQGSWVQLAPIANQGYNFTSWGGACAGSLVCVLQMNGNKNVSATFSPTPPATCETFGKALKVTLTAAQTSSGELTVLNGGGDYTLYLGTKIPNHQICTGTTYSSTTYPDLEISAIGKLTLGAVAATGEVIVSTTGSIAQGSDSIIGTPTLNLAAGSDIGVSSPLATAGVGVIDAKTTKGSIDIAGAAKNGLTLDLVVAGGASSTISVSNLAGEIAVGTVTALGTVTLQAATTGHITQASGNGVTSGNLLLEGNAGIGTSTAALAVDATGLVSTSDMSGEVDIASEGTTFEIGSISTTGVVNLSASGTVTESPTGELSLGQGATMSGSSLTLTNQKNSFAGDVTIQTSGNLDIGGNGVGSLNPGALGGTFTLNIVGSIQLDLGGYATLIAVAGNGLDIIVGGSIANHKPGHITAGGSVVMTTKDATATQVCIDQEIAGGNIISSSTGGDLCY